MIAFAIGSVYTLTACVFMGVFRATFKGDSGGYARCERCCSSYGALQHKPVDWHVWFWAGVAWPFTLLAIGGNWFGSRLRAAYEAAQRPSEGEK